jgi:mono/diheme cytochrome c family protein
MTSRIFACSALAAGIVALSQLTLAQAPVAQPAPPAAAAPIAPVASHVDKIWTGVYSEAQTERGKVPFTGVCRRCHGDDLGGTRRGPALHGESFMADWEAQDLTRLLDKIRDTMPPDNPSSLDDQEYLDVLTYLLKANGYPAGEKELTAEAMEDVQITRKLKPGELPPEPRNFSVVEVVGCLMQAGERAWTLTRTTDPVLTNGRPSTALELEALTARPLGTHTFELVGVAPFKPDGRSGQKIEAKGLLYRAPQKARLDLSSFQIVSPSCS